MKKKKTITLIAACMALFAGTQTSLAQNGVLLPENQVDTRRGDAIPATPSTWIGYIKLADNVNNEFGAGESSTINSGSISWPASNGLKNPPEIQLGSDYSQNIVINSYNGHGYASGVIKFTVGGVSASKRTVTPSKYTTWKDYTADTYPGWAFPGGTEVFGDELNVVHEGTGNPTGNMTPEISYGHTDMGAVKGIYYSFATTKNSPDAGGSYETNTVDIYLMNHDAAQSLYSFTGGHWQTKATSGLTPYTSTVDAGVDDGVDLFQFDGDSAVRTTADIKDAPTVGNNKLKPYVRPTTIALNGNNEFEQINFKTIEWQYRYHNIKNAPSVSTWYNIGSTVNIFNDDIRGGCGCHDEMKFQTTSISGEWDYTTEPGNTKVDAAVQLLKGSDVCVSGSVTDATGNIGSKNSDDATYVKTNALVVYPGANGNARLRTFGDFKANMDNEPNALTTNALYSHTDFPDANASIFLMEGDKTFDFGKIMEKYDNGGDVKVLNADNSNTAMNSLTVPTTTSSSVFGVNGQYAYETNMAQINTSEFSAVGDSANTGYISSTTNKNNRGVIEVGQNTAAQNGAQQLYIYSGGILKNFESECKSLINFPMNLGDGGTNAPYFQINGTMPLSIINYGNNNGDDCLADLNWYVPATDHLKTAIEDATTTGTSPIHIQALGDVHFYDNFILSSFGQPRELRVLADKGGIQFLKQFTYNNTQDANLIVWAKGSNVGKRSCIDDTLTCGSGEVLFDMTTSITQEKKGITLLRSENDDVLMNQTFEYKNENTNPAMNGEFIMQAGQDIYANGNMTYTQSGNENVLLEAKHTIHAKQTVTFNKDKATSANSGDFILKAGYDNFSPSAVAEWTGKGDCRSLINDDVIKIYKNREECTDTEGGDIWFEGPVVVNIKAKADDNTTSTLFRAYNSVFIDDALTYTQETKKGGNARIFAHTGNIEAIKNDGKIVLYDIKNADNTGEIRLQAGNVPAGTTGVPDTCQHDPENLCSLDDLNEWNGNILFNKTFNITNKGKGYTVLSAERDIETQIKGEANFTYDNALAGDFNMTAGRHIETHAPMIYTYTNKPASNITMEAGRGRGACIDYACEAIEEVGSNLTKDGDPTLAYDPTGTYVNTFSKGGFGNGSILMFAPVKFDYDGSGLIYMKAVNGNIESDPYLHPANGGYGTGSLLSFDHKGKGVTKMQAIDIRLHDKINYNANSMDIENGQFYMLAYDSIITRDLTYTNAQDTGSIYIITDKYKSGCNKIQQGHIVLGYGADCTAPASNDNITFDFVDNPTNTTGANVHILAGFAGFNNHTSKRDSFGGNITFDYIKAKMAVGNHAKSGYMEMKTPNGNIWGKDSITFFGQEGDLLVDAGMGSKEDSDAEAWVKDQDGATTTTYGMNTNILNTSIPIVCEDNNQWRTGNIMMKGGSLNFSGSATGNATFRTRKGYIDTYDAFNVYGMKGQLLKYAHDDEAATQWGDVSERDFTYTPAGGSVYYGADDNIMFNYGNSNGYQEYTNDGSCQFQGIYDCTSNHLVGTKNPYYNTTYGTVTGYAKFDVNTNGYQWYVNKEWEMPELHKLFRGGSESCNNSGIAGTCATPSNGAHDLKMDFSVPNEGGFASVANNYIDFFTKFIYNGGQGNGMVSPTVGSIIGESVTGYGLFIKSRHEGVQPEERRATCDKCSSGEWPAVTFHDDTRIHAENQRINLEGPVVEFFGHTELDAQSNKGSKTDFAVKADSLIFHDSAVFDGPALRLLPFTTAGRGMRHGIVNDVNIDFYKGAYRQAITMTDRMLPILELGYQRCNEPLSSPNKAPNMRSDLGLEDIPTVGGDVIVAVKNGFTLPIFNTVVANHARISFVSDSLDGAGAGDIFRNAFVRTDLLRIRNKVEFYTGEGSGNNDPKNRVGRFEMLSTERMDVPDFNEAGIYPKHLHMEPGSELSIPGENTLTVNPTTTVGGYGEIHEDIYVVANGTIAPGHSSLMEYDCTSGKNPGMLKVHNLTMDKDAEFRISLGDQTENNATGVDTLYVEDTVRFNGKIPLYVLTDVKSVETGCYTFLIYNDKDGVSKEYVKNFTLMIDRYEDNYFSLNYSTPGEVKLCVSKSPTPTIQQYVELPTVEGVTLSPFTGGKHYVGSQQNFTFYATYTGAPLKVMGDGVYDGKHVEILGEKQSDGSYKYVLTYVVEPWTITIGPEFATNFVGNEAIEGNKVWAYKNMLYVNVSESDIASIYTMTGVLYKRVELPEGSSKFTLDKGMYIVTLKDGSVHKIVIK